jgi:hypothetical protein
MIRIFHISTQTQDYTSRSSEAYGLFQLSAHFNHTEQCNERSVGPDECHANRRTFPNVKHSLIRVQASHRAHSPTSSQKGTGSCSPTDKEEGPYSHNFASNLVQRLMLRNTNSSPPPPPPHDTSGEVIG